MTRGVRSRRPGCRATATDISPKDLEPPLIALKTLNERSRKISILRISAPPISFFIPFSNLSFPFFFVSSRLERAPYNLSLLILFFISFLARDCFMRIERQSLKVPPSPPSPPPALPPTEGKQCSAGEKEGKEKKRNEKKD